MVYAVLIIWFAMFYDYSFPCGSRNNTRQSPQVSPSAGSRQFYFNHRAINARWSYLYWKTMDTM